MATQQVKYNDRITFPSNHKGPVGDIPDGILYIIFDFYVTNELEPYNIPSSALHVVFGEGIANLTKGILPHGLDILEIHGHRSRVAIIEENAIPDTVTRMRVVHNVEYRGIHLPRNLVYLTLSNVDAVTYNNMVFPPSLETIQCEFCNGDIGIWVENIRLRKLKIYDTKCSYYPSTLESLHVSTNIGIDIDISRLSLKYLSVDYEADCFDFYPDTIKKMCTTYVPNVIPRYLESLTIIDAYIDGNPGDNLTCISSDTLIELHIGESYRVKPGNLPKLETLDIKHRPNMDFPTMPNLTTLDIYATSKIIDWSFVPSSVVSIRIRSFGNHIYPNSIPGNVKALYSAGNSICHIPPHIELYRNSKLDLDVIKESNIKIFCVDSIYDGYPDVTDIKCMVFYQIQSYEIFPREIEHSRYFSQTPLKDNEYPYYYVVELGYTELGLSCRIPDIYLYEFIPKSRKLPKSARK